MTNKTFNTRLEKILQSAFTYGLAVGKLGKTSDEHYEPNAEVEALRDLFLEVLPEKKKLVINGTGREYNQLEEYKKSGCNQALDTITLTIKGE